MQTGLSSLSNQALLDRLDVLATEDRRVGAEIVAHLAEVEARGLHLDLGYSSLFRYAHERLGFSRDVAFKRIRAARCVRSRPEVIEHLESGALSLSGLVAVASQLDELLDEAVGKTTREIEELVAARCPESHTPGQWSARPVAEGTCELTVTVSMGLVAKLERAIALSRHRNPEGRADEILESGLDRVIAEVEKERFAVTEAPRVSGRAATSGPSAATKREVYERDRGSCSFVGVDGTRCGERAFVEIDHALPRAFGGTHEADNLRLYCRAHNQRAAVAAFGTATIDRARAQSRGHPLRSQIESALTGLGFKTAEARRATSHALAGAAAEASLEDLLRAALRALAPPAAVVSTTGSSA